MSFEEWFDQHFGSTDTDVAQAPPPDQYGFSLGRAARNAWDMTGEGPSAREQEAAAPQPPPPPPGIDGWSFNRAVQNFPRQIPEVYDQLKQQILPPGFSPSRGMDSALGPAKWLFNEVRQGVLPDEAIENIKKDPTSLDSLGAYLNAAISLSRGADGEPIPLPEKPGAMPLHVWNSMKPLDVGPGKTYMAGQGGEIRVDDAGNHFQMVGTHQDANTKQEHVIVKQVEPPGSGTPLQPDQVNDLLNQLHEPEKVGPVDPNWYNPKGLPPPLNEPTLKVAWEWWDGLQKGDVTREQYDAAMDAIRNGKMPPLPSTTTTPPPPNLTPPDTLFPYNPRESLGGIQIPPGEGHRPGWMYDKPAPPNTDPADPLDKLISDWASYMDEKGIDYTEIVGGGNSAADYPKPPNTDPWDQPPSGTPPPELQPDDKTKRDWEQINKWYFMKNRLKWKPPPEHGGNNL